MIILGIDLGDVRTGISLSNTKILAFPLCTIHESNKNLLARKILELVDKYSVEKIVLGYPLNMNGSIGPRAIQVKDFQKKLSELSGKEVILWDERLSTISSQKLFSSMNIKSKNYKKNIDAAAATTILQNYLDSLI